MGITRGGEKSNNNQKGSARQQQQRHKSDVTFDVTIPRRPGSYRSCRTRACSGLCCPAASSCQRGISCTQSGLHRQFSTIQDSRMDSLSLSLSHTHTHTHTHTYTHARTYAHMEAKNKATRTKRRNPSNRETHTQHQTVLRNRPQRRTATGLIKLI